jgi:protocatechuate 3,4-dioxygenase, beta subunit
MKLNTSDRDAHAQPSMSRRWVTTLVGALGAQALLMRTSQAQAPSLMPTPRDFEGPYRPPAGTAWGGANLMVEGSSSPGKPLRVVGRVMGTDGQPLAGARLYMWQANSTGRYNHPNEDVGHGTPDPGFRGYGSLNTDAQGCYAFKTIVPSGYRRTLFGVVPWGFVPHIHIDVHAPSRVLITQINVEPARARHQAVGRYADEAVLLGSSVFAPFRSDTSELSRFDVIVERG